jgi:hypothetical protein
MHCVYNFTMYAEIWLVGKNRIRQFLIGIVLLCEGVNLNCLLKSQSQEVKFTVRS